MIITDLNLEAECSVHSQRTGHLCASVKVNTETEQQNN